jgi:RND family efflux transporter MFP subunit
VSKGKFKSVLFFMALSLPAPWMAVVAGAQEITELECIVEPEMTIELSAPVDGVVRDVAVDKSDRITRGQELATLESSVEQAVVALARARAAMDDEIESRRVERDLSRSKHERILELYAKKSVPGFEKDEVAAAAALAELALKRARNNRKLATLELDRAMADLALLSVVSPIDGVVVDRYVHPGESVKDRPLLKVAKIDPMRVEIIADSELFGLIEKGMQAQILVEGPRETSHQAQVSVVDGVVDAASGTFGVRLSLPNPGNEVIGGLKCRALFDLPDNPGVGSPH